MFFLNFTNMRYEKFCYIKLAPHIHVLDEYWVICQEDECVAAWVSIVSAIQNSHKFWKIKGQGRWNVARLGVLGKYMDLK